MSTASNTIAVPVTAVTCLEDRAHIERAVVLDLAAGVQRLRLGPVSALTVDRTLHAELDSDHPATVLDVRVVRGWTPRGPLPPADDDSVLRRRAHALEEERLALEQRRDRLRARLGLLGRLAADVLREIGEGVGHGETERTRWARELDRVDAERDTYGERLRGVDARLTTLATELGAVQQAMDLTEEEPAELLGHIELTVESPVAGPVGLRLSTSSRVRCGGPPTGPCSTVPRCPWRPTRWSGSARARTGPAYGWRCRRPGRRSPPIPRGSPRTG